MSSSEWMCNRVPGRHGQYFAGFGIGQSLIMLPGDLLAHFIASVVAVPAHLAEKIHYGLITFLTFPLISSIASLYSFRLVRVLGYPIYTAFLSSMTVIFATTYLVYSHINQENSLIYCVLCASLYYLACFYRKPSNKYLLISGCFAGFLLLIKITNLAFVACLFLVLVYVLMTKSPYSGNDALHTMRGAPAYRARAALNAFAAFVIPVVLFLLLERGYHWHRFGTWFDTYAGLFVQKYEKLGYPKGYPFNHDLLDGMLGPLISPEKSVFFFDPLLAFLLLWLCFAWRRIAFFNRALLLAVGSSFVLLLVIFGSTYWWGGDSAWGPRHHLVAIELFILLGIPPMLRDLASASRFVRIATLTVFVSAVGMQVVALPKSYNIEVGQLQARSSLRIVPLMRVYNLYSLARGDFEERNLHFGEEWLRETAISTTANTLLPIRVKPYVSHGVWLLLILVWVIATIALVLFVSLACSLCWRWEVRSQRDFRRP